METQDNGQVDVGELQRQLEEVKRAQSGSDRTVAQLREENKNLQSQLEETKSGQTLKERKLQIAAEMREKEANRKVEVYKVSAEHGLNPEEAMNVLGFTEMTDNERIEKVSEMVKQSYKDGQNHYIMQNGRKIQESNTDLLSSPNYGDLTKMSDKRIASLGDAVIDRAMAKEKQQQKITLGQMIRGVKK